MGRHTEFDLQKFGQSSGSFITFRIAFQRFTGFFDQPGTEHVLLAVNICNQRTDLLKLLLVGHGYRAGNDQRSTGFVDQDTVDFVHNGVKVIPLHQLVNIICHTHIPQIVKTELAVGSVSYIASVLGTPFIRRHHILQTAHRQAQIVEDRPHPLAVTPGKVVIDRYQLAVAPGKGIQIKRHGRHQRFTFTGRHFGYTAPVKSDPAHDLHIKGDHVPNQLLSADRYSFTAHSAAGIFHHCKRLTHQAVDSGTFG